MPDYLPKLITAIGGAKGIIALLVFLGANGAWGIYHTIDKDDAIKEVETSKNAQIQNIAEQYTEQLEKPKMIYKDLRESVIIHKCTVIAQRIADQAIQKHREDDH